MAYYINPNAAFAGKQGASDVLGQLYRAQWDDWKTRFQPYVERLASLATDETYAGAQAATASAATQQAYTNSGKGLQMQQQGLGVSLTPAQQASQQRKLQVGQAADSVTAGNNARIAARDLQDQILAGGMGLSNIPNTGQVQQG